MKLLQKQNIIYAAVTGFLFLYAGCQKLEKPVDETALNQGIYPQTENVRYSGYEHILYVSKRGNDLTGNGSKEQPFESIGKALKTIPVESAEKKYAVCVGKGVFTEQTLQLINKADLFGGFNDQTWERDINQFRTTLSGGEKCRIIVAADSSKIDGFFITEGRVQGNGAAILCNSTSPVISNNVFFDNMTTGPDNWNPEFMHETAHDGGAIYGSEGASPEIRGNLFVNNKTENGRGGAVAFVGRCRPVIRSNTFLSNITGLDDPMRSSDGGAVSIFNWCNAVIEGNVFLGNRAESKNDGGAVFIALWSSASVVHNLFVDNQAGDDAGALFVGGQEHRYDAPLDALPPADEFFVKIRENSFIGNQNPSRNSGAMRLTMETRGEFLNNIVAFNDGIYFQRSETMISGNTILDDFLIIESKEGLGVSTVEDNIIWADINQDDVPVVFRDNRARDKIHAGNTLAEPPEFWNDGLQFQAAGKVYQPRQFQTKILVHDKRLKSGEFANRVIRCGEKWGVIKSNTESDMVVWGDMSEDVMFTILPTYTLKHNN